MRILSITSSYPRYAGDPTAPFVESITRTLAACGHEIHLVLPENSEWNRPAAESGVHYHPYRYSPRRSWTPWGYSESLEGGIRIRKKLYALAPVVLASAVRRCNAALASGGFDLVHVHWVIPNGPIGAHVARRHSLPLVVSLHGSDVSVSQKSGWIGRVTRSCFERADAVTAPSEDLLERARSLGAERLLERIPYGADVDALSPDPAGAERARADLGIAPDETVVCGVGRFVHWKGFDYLIDAFARARSTVGDLRLVLVGDGDLRGELEARVQELGLGERAIFVGMASRDAMPGYLAAADIVVVPSIHYEGYVDGLPNVALEALASGRALVATGVGGLPQLVRSGENGLLVGERDSDALAEAIVALARDPVLRGRMGESGRRMMVESMSWDATARRFESVFERVLRNRGIKG